MHERDNEDRTLSKFFEHARSELGEEGGSPEKERQIRQSVINVWISCCVAQAEMAEVTAANVPTTYGWLSNLPLAASAGNAVYNIYEGSKRYNCVTRYAFGGVESSVKMAASAVAPVVKKLDKPSKN